MNPAQREAHRVETTRKQLQQQRGGGADLAAKLSMCAHQVIAAR